MKRTAWYTGITKPVRKGWYERDYAGVIGFGQFEDIHRDYWDQLSPGDGFWYVDEFGELNDAFYENLPWRGIAK